MKGDFKSYIVLGQFLNSIVIKNISAGYLHLTMKLIVQLLARSIRFESIENIRTFIANLFVFNNSL